VRDEGNPRVRASRARLCEDPRLATTPFDVLRGRGWIDAEAHAAGLSFARLCRQAGLIDPRAAGEGGAPMARFERAEAAAPSGRLSSLPDAEIARAFDAAFSGAGSIDFETRAERATAALARFAQPLSPAERRRLFAIAVVGEWPAWLFRLVEAEPAGRASPADVGELDLVRRALGRLLRRP
jgi:hypothetical protein